MKLFFRSNTGPSVQSFHSSITNKAQEHKIALLSISLFTIIGLYYGSYIAVKPPAHINSINLWTASIFIVFSINLFTYYQNKINEFDVKLNLLHFKVNSLSKKGQISKLQIKTIRSQISWLLGKYRAQSRVYLSDESQTNSSSDESHAEGEQ